MTRLTLPLAFRGRVHAISAAEANSLWPYGAVITSDSAGKHWRIVIDTARPDAVQRFLQQHMPGVAWLREERE